MSDPSTWKTLAEWHAYNDWIVSGACPGLTVRMDADRQQVWLTNPLEAGGDLAAGPHRLYTDKTGVTRVDPAYLAAGELVVPFRDVMAEVDKISAGGGGCPPPWKRRQ